ncbi:MAG TPA: TolC family protein [Bryobacteraceae bacterium]|nr:TolC family protein [Bryobacteraceae bacterium]
MLKSIFVLFVAASAVFGENHSLTLKQAVGVALEQSPDIVLSRLDEQKAKAAIRVARDPFTPKVFAGSGAAKVWGYPGAIEGSAPSIIQSRTDMALFNRPKSYELARVRETARGAAITTEAKADEAAYQVASQYIDVQQLARSAASLALEVESLERVASAMQLRIEEGRELPIESKRVAVDLARARQRSEALQDDLDYARASLSVVLGFSAGDRVLPVDDDARTFEVPASEEAARALALENNKDLRKIQSQLVAKGFEVKEYGLAGRLPTIDLVAQYALFAKNQYQAFFNRVQRNNTELGASISIPILPGSAGKGFREQALDDVQELKTQMQQTRNRIDLDVQHSYEEMRKAASAREVARLDLDYAREQVSVLLAQLEEGRATQQRIDDARLNEQEKWIAYYDTQRTVEKARLDVLRQTGTLRAALR